MTYIALHVEKWLYGTTRMEMEPDEIACWTYILARAAVTGADPPGLIYYFSEEHLASQLQVSLELLQRTLEKCKKFKKIKIKTLKRENKYVLSAVNWEKYQHVNMHQKAYRQRQKKKKEAQKKQYLEGTKKHNQKITGDNGLVDRIGKEKIEKDTIEEEGRGEHIRGEETTDSKLKTSLPSKSKFFNDGKNGLLQEYLSRLGDCPGYPLDDYKDIALFHHVEEEYPGIDILKELDKKIIWWEEHPDALKPSANPRIQLAEWFEKEHEFQNK